jgi:hypothetical protein
MACAPKIALSVQIQPWLVAASANPELSPEIAATMNAKRCFS